MSFFAALQTARELTIFIGDYGNPIDGELVASCLYLLLPDVRIAEIAGLI